MKKLLSLTLALATLSITCYAEQPKAADYRNIMSSGNYYVEYEYNYAKKILAVQNGTRMDYTMLQSQPNTALAALGFINPLFAIGMNLTTIRKTYPSLKIAALTSSLIDNQLLSDYDTTISINDDIETICSKIKEAVNEPDEESSEQDALSAREKEIIGCVVKGMTNKAIADTLSISIYTVITHRRNISRKLQIHSPAGLAIYAIANNLVNIEDIKDVIN